MGLLLSLLYFPGIAAGKLPEQVESVKYLLSIEEQNLADALVSLSTQADIQILFPYEVAKNHRANGVAGSYSLPDALDILLANSKFSWSLTQNRAFVVRLSDRKSHNDKARGESEMKFKKGIFAALTGVMAISATAQEAATETKVSGGTAKKLIEEVLVTAQKKAVSESAQDIPLAISAFSGDKIEAMFAEDLQDIGLTSPNVALTPLLPGVGNFFIRGMGTGAQSIPSSDPAVGVVVDGLSYGTIYGVMFDVFDVESVEVLRGPQGTLFGRNVTGGAVSVRTARPTDEFQGKVKATIGSHDRADVLASMSGPLSDQWSGKLAVLSKNHGDLWDNEYMSGGHGQSDSLVIRPAIKYDADNFDITAIAEYGKTEGDGTAIRNFWLDGVERNPYDKAESTQDDKGLLDQEWKSLVLESNIDSWGGVITSIIGYRELEQQQDFDIDGAPGTARFHFAPGTGLDQDQFSIESRWAGSLSDNLYLTSGLYYFQQDYEYRERRFLLDAVDRRGVSMIDHESYAIFAQADYNLSESLTLTLGGRYTIEKKEGNIGVIGDPTAVGDCATHLFPFDPTPPAFNDCEQVFHDKETWKNFTPKVALAWTPTAELLFYSSYSRGARSGGYNTRFTDTTLITNPSNPNSTPGPYDEEIVDAFEVGMKSDWLDGNLRMNLALFYNEFDDLQRTALSSGGAQATLNAASAEIQGVELEVVVLITPNLAFEGSFGYLDAEYKEADFLEAATGRPAESFDFTMVPDKTSSMALTYDTDFAGLGTLTSRLSYSFFDDTVGDDFNRALISQYELYDASLTYTNYGEDIKIAVFGRNLKDEVYANYANDITALGTKAIFLAPPRTYGIELSYYF